MQSACLRSRTCYHSNIYIDSFQSPLLSIYNLLEALYHKIENDAMDSTAHQSSDRLNSSINVNLPIAYLLYFFGGIFGLHHAYLNRPYQGLAWYATCGLFGFGLLRDLYRIPTYVSLCRDDRTNDVAARVRAATIVAREGVPKFSLVRVIDRKSVV